LNGVKFDGMMEGVLIEVKGPGYLKFLKENEFVEWFRGRSGLLEQARNQLTAAQGAPVVWHVAEEAFARKLRQIFSDLELDIRVVFTPAR
jgi:hypothetical protein